MGERLKVAAATVNVVPFNCIICFEEFNLKDRLPQVLPCGHTFVCDPCSKRLNRCMECREPLYYTKTTVSPMKHVYRGSPPGRYSPTPMTPPQNSHAGMHGNVEKIRYPIAKNLVLISMMEAAERMEREKQEDIADDSLQTDEEELDINNIICGVANMTGPSGTYAVKDPKGLVVSEEIAIFPPPTERELNIAASEDSVEIGEAGTMLIQRGQTVQIVSFANGVAKLARNKGFIKADESQLVRVGDPREKTCVLEGLLDTVARRGSDLERELEENKKIEAKLRQQIQDELATEPDHPVITDLPKIDIDEPDKAKEPLGPSTPTDVKTFSKISQPDLRTPETSPDSDLQQQAQAAALRVAQNGIPVPDANFPLCALPNDDGTASLGHSFPVYRRTASGDSLTELGYGCTAFLGTGAHMFNHDRLEEDRLVVRRSITDAAQEDYTLTASSFDTVDFRTGMSGHRGLQRTKKSKLTNSPVPRRAAGGRLMMSVHDGIAAFRGGQQKNRTSPS